MRIHYSFVGFLSTTSILLSHSSVFAGADYNGDGYQDLAVGSPYKDLGGLYDVGRVDVFHGGPTGLAHSQAIWQNVADPLGAFAVDTDFGFSLANGDFNGDGYTDLAIGAPGTTVNGAQMAGAVHIAYGSKSGLSIAQTWSQDSPGIADFAEPFDRFGSSLVAGDFNGDGRDDLAIGVMESVNGKAAAGAVHVLFGHPKGLKKKGDQFWHQDIAKLNSVAGSGEAFGFGLCAGDWNDDGFQDLAIGVPQDDDFFSVRKGSVQILFGSKSGLRGKGNLLLAAGSLPGDPSDSTLGLGGAFAAADIDGDGIADLLIGAPGANIAGKQSVGAVFALFGRGENPLAPTSAMTIVQSMPGVGGGDNSGDRFGWSLAVGDVNGDGRADLIVGTPGEDHYAVDEGMFRVLYGANGVPFPAWSQLFGQAIFGASPEAGDEYGNAIAVGDFTGDGVDDIAVSSVLEDSATIAGVGAFGELRGAFGLGAVGPGKIWTESVLGGQPVLEDRFGFALAR